MPLPDPTQPAGFASGPADADQSAPLKEGVGLVRHYEGLLPGRRPYAWKCPGCGAGNYGHVEEGCVECGAGRDGKVGRPEPAVDPLCRACRGNKTIPVRCKPCNGSGEIDGEGCLDCGGGGMLTIDCRRCGGTGFDPQPQAQQPVMPHGIPEPIGTSEDFPLTHRPGEYLGQPRDLTGMAKIMTDSATPRAPLPTLEDDSEPTRGPEMRYFILAVGPFGLPAVTVEIRESPKVRQIISNATKKEK